jgi:hypothetical protein
MNNLNFNPKFFDIDRYGNLYPILNEIDENMCNRLCEVCPINSVGSIAFCKEGHKGDYETA